MEQSKNIRIEKDSLGEVAVNNEMYWGAQTQRSLENFKIGNDKMPKEIIDSIVLLKKCCAKINKDLKKLSEEKQFAINRVCDEILQGKYYDNFPLVVFQTGSGTQTNMNVNEVISNISKRKYKTEIHPNDDVNMSQSSNDVFPSAIHIATYIAIHNKLLPAINKLIITFNRLEEENKDIIKIGRTHLQDATPISLGQEISGWKSSLEKNYLMIVESSKYLLDLAIGGTAVGTGINAPKEFSVLVCKELNDLTDINFKPSINKFHSLTSKSEIVLVQGALNALASDLFKIANDIRWLSSGPRCGIGELIIPANEPGSSIMPGKINPTQVEALTMVCLEVFGASTTINFASSSGNFELNVFMPLIAYNVIRAINLLSDAIASFNIHCAMGIKANKEKINENLNNSLMLVTALSPLIGYDNSAKVAKYAFDNNITLKQACIELNVIDEETYNNIVNPKNMI